MTSTFHTRAIVFSRQAFRENDLRVVVYSKQFGKLTLISKGALKLRSKLAGHLEPLTLIDLMVVKGRGGDYIGSACGRNFFYSLKQDLIKLNFAGAGIRLIKKETREGDNEKAKEIFSLLEKFLELLNQEKGSDYEMLNLAFFLEFLSLIGFAPNFYSCSDCGKKNQPGNNFFSPGGGGVICQNCQKQGQFCFPVSNDCLKILKFLSTQGLVKSGNLRLENSKLRLELVKVIKAFYNYNF